MSPHQYGWRDSARLRAGLLWKGKSPTPADYPSLPKCILMLLLVLILWSWAQDRQYAEEMAAEAARQADIAEKRANQLGQCIEGVARFTTEDGNAIACRRAEEFPI